MSRVLVIEDEPDMVKGLRNTLELHGYEVLVASDGATGLARARDPALDAIVLDLMLPRRDGTEILRRLRSESIHTPILVLTAKGTEEDKVRGLDLGADDYVTKPFSIAEVLARVKALLRRSGRPHEGPPRFAFGEKVIDFQRRCLVEGGREVPLTHYELEILRLLVRAPGEAVARRRFIEEIWGETYHPTSRTLDYHVLNLRRKIEPRPARPRHVVTVHGIGYAFRVG